MYNGNNTGIYKIESTITGEIYIGASFKLSRRDNDHFSTLRNKTHTNNNLQNHANKYGVDDLKFSVIEFCDKKQLTSREQYYIDDLNPVFNIMKKAGCCINKKAPIEIRIEILNDIIKDTVRYSKSFNKAYCYLAKDKDSIIIEKEMKNKNFPNFTTKIPVSDIGDVIVKERAKLANYNKL